MLGREAEGQVPRPRPCPQLSFFFNSFFKARRGGSCGARCRKPTCARFFLRFYLFFSLSVDPENFTF